MRPSDEKPFPLITATMPGPRASRSIKARDYALPKPYRKKTFVEDEPRMSRVRVTMLTLSCLTIASLVGALAMLAKENLDTPPVLIVAAPVPETAKIPLARLAVPVVTRARLALADGLPAAAARAREVVQPHPTVMRALAAKTARAPRAVPKPEAPPPDPDVDLVTVILTLTMPSATAGADSAAACSAATPSDHGCPAIHGMEP